MTDLKWMSWLRCSIAEEMIGDDPDRFGIFELGFCVGRLFSSAQNYVTLEPDASKAADYERSYKERGRKGKSDERKRQRLAHLFRHIRRLVVANPDFSRMKPIEIAKLALIDAVEEDPKLWTQGKGQLEEYLTKYASDDEYRSAYRELFPKTG